MSHGERTRAESVGWVYMYSASEACVCVNQGDIRPVWLALGASFAWPRVVAGFHARLFGCYRVKKKARLAWIPLHFN